MTRGLSFILHVLTARLDRAADRMLQAEHGVSYNRFLALTMVGELDVSTQRALADALGVTEPSVSRMVGVLAADGLLDVQRSAAGERGRRLSLTEAGSTLVASVQSRLEERFAELVKASGVGLDEYAEQTARLLGTLEQVQAREESTT
ncbi:winged helix-turn-helix transcriptional regulator [Microbacterium sp. CFH 90308]|uniref:Winged helix-turn-helix transcriptional regulator n=1 Tax=Microbacterium salsuginis TaxID=2722803 RepID=A0ABX1KAY6_9MICO|nr:MarR family winged helix-turn-helix transcriptional regulator [Microbacterium sp. CFH 90308]NLP84194.1 winged helix-turn-helix transcriptional regulator [Microbacterium sp. CFH 90308]